MSLIDVVKNSPHPNAARLFDDWLVSKPGQEAVVKITIARCRDSHRRSGRAMCPLGGPAPVHGSATTLIQDEGWCQSVMASQSASHAAAQIAAIAAEISTAAFSARR
ncbi:hypothetical protein [Amycolatopsis sp. DSM 110486]|uniref:hypothetical protein n=1 Tax=Amycolatopsis sp. DSM 110486 TaxID=2865832 RepID=UPI001C6A3AD3|nr:hypothetical protein [Amycolatopsis sp. DSM 110486]QYN18981.1 hypothetical protein K1T34_40875 [Amycolatopsis sp. DSM 110486]